MKHDGAPLIGRIVLYIALFASVTLASAEEPAGLAPAERTPAGLPPAERAPVRIEYYGEIGCAHCDTFKDKDLPAALEASGASAELELVDILSAAGFARCEERLSELGYAFRVFPVLVIGPSAYQGNAAIDANLVPELRHYAATGSYRPRYDDSADGSGAAGPGAARSAARSAAPGAGMRWAVLPIALAGLVDGVNPCAFTTLLFFMSYLGLRGGSRRRMAAVGLLFAAGVFASYFMIGLGLFNALRASGRIRELRLALRILVSVLTAAFCAFTVRDIVMIRRGRPAEVALRLPERMRSGINAAIRSGVGGAAFLAGVFGTGVVVSVLELACTGQVYFPAISVMVQSDASPLGIASLALYNLAFITPLLALLALALAGVRQEAVRAFFERRLVLSKAAVALVFATLAVLVWLF